MKDFRELNVWVKAHALTLDIYKTTLSFPVEERYGLTSQIRRACASIATNISEGCGRNSDGELARFLEIAMGSASEVEYLLLLNRDLGHLDDKTYRNHEVAVTEVKRMLTGLIKKLKADR